jgi:hypothetical protein
MTIDDASHRVDPTLPHSTDLSRTSKKSAMPLTATSKVHQISRRDVEACSER